MLTIYQDFAIVSFNDVTSTLPKAGYEFKKTENGNYRGHSQLNNLRLDKSEAKNGLNRNDAGTEESNQAIVR